MRIRIRQVLVAVAAAATATLITAGPVHAGGPTSVIIVNPATGDVGALYLTDRSYQVLLDALEPAPDISVEEPGALSAGPGTPAINITWLIHDVEVWRIDHVRLDLKYVWVQTTLLADGNDFPYDSGAWRVAANGNAVLDVLDELGVLPGSVQPDAGALDGGSAGSVGASNEVTVADQPVDEAPPSTVLDWPWIAVAAVGGIGLGVVARPAVWAVLRRRESGPRQQLVDLELPEGSEQGSGQADTNSAKASPLILHLGNLDPADLPR